MVRLFGSQKSGRPAKARLGLERLEDRDVPATFTVTNLNDAGAGSLRQAIADANANADTDAIVFRQGLSGTITLTGGQLNVTQPVSITGPGAEALTINANNASRVFLIDDGTTSVKNVALSGMRLTGGGPGNQTGGGLFLGNENLVLKDMEIIRNVASKGGGIWVNAGGRLTMLDTFVALNKSSAGEGGGLFLAGGSQTHIGSSNIAANTAEGSVGVGGGGILAQPGAVLTVQGSIVSNNTSQTDAGGILVRQGATMVMRDSTVAFNQTQGFGGGMQLDRAGSVTVENSTISGNESNFQGGGVWMTGTTAVMRNSTIAFNKGGKNFAVSAGGGIMVDDQPGLTNTITLQGTIVARNERGTAGQLDDISGNLQATSALNLIGVGDGMTGVINGGNGNMVGTAVAPLDPKLGPLALNGGKTPTHALLPGSLALDAGFNFAGMAADQRGGAFARTVGIATDIGAFEVQPPAPTPPQPPPQPQPQPNPAVVDVQVKRVGGRTRVDVKVDGTLRRRVFPFGKFKGRVQVAKADVNGDGLLDVIARATVNGKKRTRTFTT